MSLARVTTWSLGDILTAAALNGEFNNILNNPMSLISPATANFDLDTHLLIDAVHKNVPIAFTAQDSTPDVSQGTIFTTANASSTTISMFDSAVDGQRIWVIINDANTTFDFTGTNLVGNNGVDWTPALGDSVQAVFVNPKWYCRINGSELAGAVAPIIFPAVQVADAGANVLDDYEEGAWTPTAGGTSTYFSQVGAYIKIGRLVHVSCSLQVNAIGTGDPFLLDGLPFPVSSRGIGSVVVTGSAVSFVTLVASAIAGGTTIGFSGMTAAGTTMTSQGPLGNSTFLSFSLSYMATE